MNENEQFWLWEQLGAKSVAMLRKHGFDAHWTPTIEAANELIAPLLAPHQVFGFGGSVTVRQLGVAEKLLLQGKTVWDHWRTEVEPEEDLEIRKAQLNCECFLCSANAVSCSGEIVCVDGIGNRTNAMSFGPTRVVIVAGMNKVTKDLASAMSRVREIAGPMRARSLGTR